MPTTKKRPSVLILDDAPAFKKMFAVLLEFLKWDGEVVTCPSIALQRLKKRRFDVLMLDAAVCKSDELAIIESLHQEKVPIPIIVMSEGKETLRQVAERHDNLTVPLAKPFTVDALSLALDAAFNLGKVSMPAKEKKPISRPKK